MANDGRRRHRRRALDPNPRRASHRQLLNYNKQPESFGSNQGTRARVIPSRLGLDAGIMMNTFLRSLILAAAVFGLIGAAAAAEPPRAVQVAAPKITSWAGLYLGAQGGYAR